MTVDELIHLLQALTPEQRCLPVAREDNSYSPQELSVVEVCLESRYPWHSIAGVDTFGPAVYLA